MPVSVITDIVTWAELISQIGITTVELGVLNYLVFFNGWLDMIRLISFYLDSLVIKYIDKFYSYFDKLLNGRIFHPDVVDKVMDNVYLFVAVIVLFRLMMLLIKYVVNPEMVSDDKIGAASLVKRVILGMALMLFLPNIFDLGIRLQSAVLSDNLIGQLLLDKSEIKQYEKNKNQMGRILAFNVYQAFWNLDESKVTSKKIIDSYHDAIDARDPLVFGGINQKFGGDYAIDYFPILSTVVLLYVIYLVIKYCLDVVVRMFKLFLLQMLGPLAITDYMINGDSKEVFKSWVKTTLSVYLMLFIRIFSIWFVAFVTMLMDKTCTDVGSNGICNDSLLYMTTKPDYLLRAFITLGLLAFLMDLPKLFSSILGLDLEQDASVKGLMQKVGGAGKMLGMGALAAGGAAIGGAIGGMKAGGNALKQFGQNKAETKAKLAKLDPKDPNYAAKAKAIKQQAGLQNRTLASSTAGAMGGAMGGIMSAALSQTPLSAATGGYQNASANAQNKANEYGNSTSIVSKAREGQLAEIKADEERQRAEQGENRIEKRHQEQMGALNTLIHQSNPNAHAISSASGNIAREDFGSNTSGNTVGGVQVSDADPLTGERITDSGLILPGSVDIDSSLDRNVNIAVNDNVQVGSHTSDLSSIETLDTNIGNIQGITGSVDRDVSIAVSDDVQVGSHTSDLSSIETLDTNIGDIQGRTESVDRDVSVDVSDTIGGVQVSSPDSLTGERSTNSGIVLPGSVDLDNKQ